MTMQFKFKIQQYQTDAARAVTDVFKGQPNQGAAMYLRDLGHTAADKYGRTQLPGFGYDGQAVMSEGYGNAEVLLTGKELLDNVRAVQTNFRLTRSAALADSPGAVSLDVEMETGTGKTYVYTKTMFELNRLYGWSKFIVVVPSIAIREGVYKSLQNTEQHFFEQYGKAIRYFIYDSSRLNDLDDFSSSPDINCMIINMQAFNSNFNEEKSKAGRGGDKAARIIFDERDDFQSRRPIDVISANRPIIIQDEPQKMGGKATQEGIARFKPLFLLNYSATHKDKHDLVYALDALDAFNQRLVKRIEVKGFEIHDERGTDDYLYLQDILVSKDKAPQAVIEINKRSTSGKVGKATKRFFETDSIYDASGELEAYRDGYTVSEIVPDMDGRLGYVTLLNGIVLRRGELWGDSSEQDIRRVQIRETIRSHLEKEEALFARGIKCLSLFFIDEVARYRQYDADGNEVLGEYGRIFEEEYRRAVEDYDKGQMSLGRSLDAGLDQAHRDYLEYLRGIDPHATHKGYFSIDKKGHSVDSKVKCGSDESDDESAYDLILKDKERLLSFDEPTRFIFSHSALREGWDNPNVFQICTLKHSDSETGKRQEVGRGLRLCVNQDGERQDLEALGEPEVQQVNTLTVVASESYEGFVKALQSDIRSVLRDRPKEVTEALFAGLTVKVGDTGKTYTFTQQDAHAIVYTLIRHGLINQNGAPTKKFFDEKLDSVEADDLPEHLDEVQKEIEAIVESVENPDALKGIVQQGFGQKVTRNKLNANFQKPEFQHLWEEISGKYSYQVSFKDEELRKRAIDKINQGLVVSKATYAMTTGAQAAHQTREGLDAGQGFNRTASSVSDLRNGPVQVRYDLLGEVAGRAHITRRSAAYILKNIAPAQFARYKENPEEFVAKVSKLIVEAKAALVLDKVVYRNVDGRYKPDVFSEQMPESMAKALHVEKAVQDYVFWDSQGERDFANDLEVADNVAVYAKLPRKLQIPTPVGNYAPDWAIAFKKGSVRHMYFVAETKGSANEEDLRDVEKAKIACARKVFNELSTNDVRYDVVDSYSDMLAKIAGME